MASPSGAGKHLIERLTLTADRLQLRYELAVEDPEYLTTPAAFTAMWDRVVAFWPSPMYPRPTILLVEFAGDERAPPLPKLARRARRSSRSRW